MSGLQDYLNWVVGEAVPSWANIGFNEESGLFHERLDRNGRPLVVPHRAMVQARQIYVFAHAARLGWFPKGQALAERAMQTLLSHYAETSAGMTSFRFSIDPLSGAAVSDTRDSYTHAFVLFALAHLYALTGDPALLDAAGKTSAFIDCHLLDQTHGGVLDEADQIRGGKRQNPQMHLLEAYLAWHEVAPNEGYDDRADAIVDLFYQKLTRPDHDVLIEHFAHDWSDHGDATKAHRFEPGHHFEWVWLLRCHELANGSIDHSGWRERLHQSATRYGVTGSSLIYDELAADKSEIKMSHRLWPHTEAIKAATVRHREGDALAGAFADAMASTLLTHFLGKPFAGGWTDQLSADLKPLLDYVPASSLYHLFLAAAEARAHFETEPTTGQVYS